MTATHSKWRAIETAPTDVSILIWGKHGNVMQASWENDGWGGYWRCGRQFAKGYDDTGSMTPTHWMPLPEPPQ